jgi:HTH-type transcriptional regulator/antitoxin HigA
MIRHKTKSTESDTFFDLVKAFPLRPIRTEAEHERASRILRRLVGSKAEDEFATGERDYIESLAILVGEHQRKRRDTQVAALTPAGILRHLMEENEMSVTDIGHVIGSRSAASMVLSGRRNLSRRHILRLTERFGVDPALLL